MESFQFSKGISSVAELWQEFYHGIDGRYSINEMDRKFRSAWRKNNGRKQWYFRRKKVIVEVRRYMNVKHCCSAEAIFKFDEFRCGRTIDWLCKHIKECTDLVYD